MSRREQFTPAPQLVAAMAAQRGLFTAAQAWDAGYTKEEIRTLLSRRVLRAVRRGVYVDASRYGALDPVERHAMEARAALLRLKPVATLSHESAAVWLGLELLRPALETVHVTRPDLSTSHVEAWIHHHPGALPVDQVLELDGVSFTAPARTAVDLARRLDFKRGLAAADSCLRSGTSAEELQAVLIFCRSWPGARAAARVVSAADRLAANPGESLSRAVLIERGLAPSALQYRVDDAAGQIGIADFAWLDRWTLGEFDGRLKYAVPADASADEAGAVVWREKRREDRLRSAGYEVVRWTWADLHRPAELAGRVLAAFARADARRRTAN